jgi:phage I-like protein
VKQLALTARCTFAVRAMALSDPQWQSIEPKRELVFPVGEPAGNDERRWRFTPEDLSLVASEFGERAEPAPVLYRHGDDPARGGMAAGWIDGVELAEDGLYALIRYTERALAEIKDGGWGYRSPGFDAEQDEEGYWRPRRLTEVSLVNDPAIAGMPPIQAATTATAPAGAPTAAINGEQEERTMGDSQTVTAAKKQSAAFDKAGLIGLLRDTYAMPEAVSDEMLVKMLMEALAGAPKPDDMDSEEKKPEEIPPADLPVPAAASAKPRIERVEDEADVATVIAEATAAGKITPANVKAATAMARANVAAFRSWIETAPVVAPPSGRIVTASAKDRAAKSTKTWAERQTEIHRVAAAKHISIEAAQRLVEA